MRSPALVLCNIFQLSGTNELFPVNPELFQQHGFSHITTYYKRALFSTYHNVPNIVYCDVFVM